MGKPISHVNLVTILIAAIALIVGLGYLRFQPIYADDADTIVENRLQAAVDAGKLTQDQVDQRLDAFNNGLMQKNGNHGKPRISAADLEAKLQAAVDAGKLTQDQVDIIREQLSQMDKTQAV
jgi:FtsZ-binding cell division protein ZapB